MNEPSVKPHAFYHKWGLLQVFQCLPSGSTCKLNDVAVAVRAAMETQNRPFEPVLKAVVLPWFVLPVVPALDPPTPTAFCVS